MRRLIVVPMVIALGGSAIGCGEEKTVSDDAIVQALDLKRADDAPVYEVGGDEFCQVEQELLNDSGEVDEAKKRKNALVVANSTAIVGIQVVPPFDPTCEQDVRKALNKLGKEED